MSVKIENNARVPCGTMKKRKKLSASDGKIKTQKFLNTLKIFYYSSDDIFIIIVFFQLQFIYYYYSNVWDRKKMCNWWIVDINSIIQTILFYEWKIEATTLQLILAIALRTLPQLYFVYRTSGNIRKLHLSWRFTSVVMSTRRNFIIIS